MDKLIAYWTLTPPSQKKVDGLINVRLNYLGSTYDADFYYSKKGGRKSKTYNISLYYDQNYNRKYDQGEFQLLDYKANKKAIDAIESRPKKGQRKGTLSVDPFTYQYEIGYQKSVLAKGDIDPQKLSEALYLADLGMI